MSERVSSLAMVVLTLIGSGCTDVTNAPAGVSAQFSTPAVFNIESAPTVEFSVPDMMCPEGCGATVKEILAKQKGAKDVRVDFEAKTVTVAIDEGEFDADKAIAALVDKQFPQSSLKGDAAAKPQEANESAVQ